MDTAHNLAARKTVVRLIVESALVAGAALSAPALAPAAPPPLLLANDYDDAEVDLSRYWVSEKYDGVRAYWDGKRLVTRAGNTIHAPEWFTRDWPTDPLDGELWAGRGRFEQVTATVRDLEPNDSAWRHIRFMVFDLPAHGGIFSARLETLRALLASTHIDWLREVTHSRVTDEAALHLQLETVAAAGGEGLMLHKEDSLYRAERNDDLLKFKPYQDAEARVIAHLPGQGKYLGMLGSLLVRTANGTEFRIGTGFTDEQRRLPPPIGSSITYSYHNLTARGIPRFARFLRARPPDEGVQDPD
ncbi:DNA ligase [Steroidobacter agaridevorans]|uniref:DNA ligase n=1 Tax=Steroidobacter agaridevorans TaxID=2695856 RepID=UPI0013299F51|nr:DNA ligase [Steroidobacter agaridevorans]GFE90496.1 ATP-dependent DNA ligase [Steroidobacter agaridevorans]